MDRIDTSCTAPGILLDWCRQHAPDLRVGYTLGPDGVREAHARFTFGDDVHELTAPDRAALARAVHAKILHAMGLGPDGRTADDATRAALEHALYAASVDGRGTDVDTLRREYIRLSTRVSLPRVSTRWNL